MKRITTFAIAVFLVFAQIATINAQTRTRPSVPPQQLQEVPVIINVRGFDNTVEAEQFMAAVLVKEIQDPSFGVKLVPAGTGRYERRSFRRSGYVEGEVERRLEVQVRIRKIKKYRGREKFKDQAKREGIRAGIEILSSKVPRKARRATRSVKRTVEDIYAPKTKLTDQEYETTAELEMYENGKLVWVGRDSREFTLSTTKYSSGYQPEIKLTKGGNVILELLPYIDSAGLKWVRDSNLDGKALQALALMVARTASLETNRVYGVSEIANTR